MRESSDFFLLLGVTNITFEGKFMESNNYVIFKLIKLQIQKMLFVKGSVFVHNDEFSPFF